MVGDDDEEGRAEGELGGALCLAAAEAGEQGEPGAVTVMAVAVSDKESEEDVRIAGDGDAGVDISDIAGVGGPGLRCQEWAAEVGKEGGGTGGRELQGGRGGEAGGLVPEQEQAAARDGVDAMRERLKTAKSRRERAQDERAARARERVEGLPDEVERLLVSTSSLI